MRRVYIESFAGALLWFTLSMVAYVYIIFELNTDYDYVLEEKEAEALRQILFNVYQAQGKKVAVSNLETYARKTAQELTIYKSNQAPKDVVEFFSRKKSQSEVYFDDDRDCWFKLVEPDVIFQVKPDPDTYLRRAIDFDDNMGYPFVIIGFLVHTFFFVLILRRRVRFLEDVTMKFAQGDFKVRASTKSGKKLGALSHNFNYMADKISDLIAGNRFLTNAIAHDLRTPIFRIQWQAEMLQAQALSEEQHKKIASIIEDTEEMEQMVDELLYYAKMERTETKLDLEYLDSSSFFQDIVHNLPNSRQLNIQLNNSVTSEFYADRALLKRAITNLLTNASKYANSQVVLTTEERESQLIIKVEDDGDGIPPQHWASIFQPFYSADSSRNKETSGFGLGLAIVELITKRHHGSAKVGQSPLGGAQFTLSFPRNNLNSTLNSDTL
ncbi:ATP-binding protein [Vibrio sp. S4M6]|uniref:ATP-binding protein n=1 Tax=Vibrio sinus TaxID=2946865 RepID=UPI002029FABA|nr:ATP-binding protein [Vibrio sinus]MCL9780990.1 ATP-binding protein [Vibrio sinus]